MAIKFVISPTLIEVAGNRNAWSKDIIMMDILHGSNELCVN